MPHEPAAALGGAPSPAGPMGLPTGDADIG
jgi:hypothetical protein